MSVRALLPVALGLIGLLVAWVAGLDGLVYAPFWLLAALPGVPLGRALTGRHPFGWVAGLAAGYATTCLMVWALIASGLIGTGALAVAWAIEAAALWFAARRIKTPWVTLPEWTPGDRVAVGAVLLMVVALMALPYRHLGAVDEGGSKRYRAYFTADFVWHMALTSEMSRFEMPPKNPYLAREPLHYYWTYFLVPAAVSAVGPAPVGDVEGDLKVNAIATAAVLLTSFYLLAWTSGAGPLASWLSVALVTIAASAEGLLVMVDLLRKGAPMARLRNINVDAVTAWMFDGLRIDGVHRTMFYTPQHGLSCALGLLALVPLAAVRAPAGWRGAVLSGGLLGLATTVNPFLGAAFSLVYGLAVLVRLVASRGPWTGVLPHAAAAVPPVLGVAWGTLNAMSEGAGEALTLGWHGDARNWPVLTLLLSLGPVLLPAIAGLIWARRGPAMPRIVAGCGLGVGLWLLYFVVLTDASWVGFRAGQILIAMMPVPLAALLGSLLAAEAGQAARRGVAIALCSMIFAIGSPTVIADTRNAADIDNFAPGPGFPWTLTVTPGQQAGIAWLKAHTRPAAVVQCDALARGRAHWSFLPSFAERRMAAGLPISLLPDPEYRRAASVVRSIFSARDAGDAHHTARQMGINYLWVDEVERRTFPDGAATLGSAPGYFERVFDNGEVQIYRVR